MSGADSPELAVALQRQLQDLFLHGGFLLRKWNSSDPAVLDAILPELRESKEVRCISTSEHDYTKTLGIEWNGATDTFRITTSEFPQSKCVTKRLLVSDISRVFDALGWIAPTTVCMKILLQRVWEAHVEWDETVPEELQENWRRWRSELNSLLGRSIPRCYFPRHIKVASTQLHGFSDASEEAYAGVAYFRIVDSTGVIHTSLVMSKTKVAPVRHLTIPRLELCGAQVLAKLLGHLKELFQVPSANIYAWTESTIVLNWLTGSPRRFKTYVGNRVSCIVDLVSPDRRGHVDGVQNPADCASRGLLPSALLDHDLWWTGPNWLRRDEAEWPKQPKLAPNTPVEEGQEVCHHIVIARMDPVLPFKDFSSFSRLKRITAWVIRFIQNCQARKKKVGRVTTPLNAD